MISYIQIHVTTSPQRDIITTVKSGSHNLCITDGGTTSPEYTFVLVIIGIVCGLIALATLGGFLYSLKKGILYLI